jgi:hypothetical protein
MKILPGSGFLDQEEERYEPEDNGRIQQESQDNKRRRKTKIRDKAHSQTESRPVEQRQVNYAHYKPGPKTPVGFGAELHN